MNSEKTEGVIQGLEDTLSNPSFFGRVLVKKEQIQLVTDLLRGLKKKNDEQEALCRAAEERATALTTKLAETEQSLSRAIDEQEALCRAAEERATALTTKLAETEQSLSRAIDTTEHLTAKVYRLNPSNRNVLPLGQGIVKSKSERRCRRVLLVGWYGAQNFGDELMLRCMLQRFAASPKKDFDVSVLIERNDRYRFSNIPKHVRCFYPPETEMDLLAACDWFDEIVLGGGAHIDDAPLKNLDFIPYLMIRLSQEALNRGKTVRWISASSNRSLKDPMYLRALREIAAGAATFSVRDAFSLDVLREAGVPNVTLDRDIAFDVEPFAGFQSKIVLVTLVDFADADLLEKVVDDLFGFFADRMSNTEETWQLCFLPFYLENSNDRSLYERLLKKANTRGVPYFIAEEIESAETMLMLFRTADLAVSMRYHAALLADVFNVPNLVLCPDSHRHYFNKMHALSNAYPKISRLTDVSVYTTETLCEHLKFLSTIRAEISPSF